MKKKKLKHTYKSALEKEISKNKRMKKQRAKINNRQCNEER